MFFKKRCSEKFRKFHGKTPVLESLFFVVETPMQMFSCEIYEIFKNTYLEEHLQMTASKFA